VKPFDRFASAVALLALLLPMAACSKDTETAKREHLARGDRYVEQKKLAEAAIEYKNAIKLDPRFGEARFNLGETYEKLGDGQGAYNEFIRAQELLPDRDDVQLKAAIWRSTARQYKEARETAQKLVDKNPKNIDAQIVLANALAELKDLPAAIKELESAVQQDPTRIGSYTDLAQYQQLNKNPAEAENVLRAALAAKPDSVEARLGLVNIYWANRDLAKAEAVLKEALALQPKHQAANEALAKFYLLSGRANEAEVPLKTVAESGPALEPKLMLARYYFLANRGAEAVPILNELLKDKKGRAPASMLLARWEYYGNGQKEAAQKRLDEYLTQQPNDFDALLLKAQMLAGDGKVDEALAKAQAASVVKPREAAAPYAIGTLLLQKKDSEGALKAFNDALGLDPTRVDASLQIAKLQLDKAIAEESLAEAESALGTAEEVVRKQPGNPEARSTLIRALMARANLYRGRGNPGDTDKARQDVLRAEKEAVALAAALPQSPEAHILVGAAALLKGDFPAARAAYARALAINKSSTAAAAGLIAVDMASGKPNDAKAQLAARLAADPKNPGLLEVAGRAYMSLGDTAKADETWRKLIEVQPSNLAAYAALGQIYYAQGRLEDARAEYEKYLQRDPKNEGANTALGIFLQMLGRLPDAQKQYERTIQLHPDAAVAANNLAWMYAEQGANLDLALQLAETAKRKLPEKAEVDDTLGFVYYKRGLWDLAIASFTQSTTKDPKNPGYHYHLGIAQLGKGDKAKARESLQKALALGGNFKEAPEAKKILATM
jgi:tetratricopeptide (TPR) repeat protein